MVKTIFSLLAQAPPPNPIISLLPLILIFFIFYFMLIKPQKAREKEHREMLNNLKKSDGVVTSGGIHGTIVEIKDNTVILKVDDNTKIMVEKSAIAYVKK
ncbi:MAG: preprotein translocase subunit YajC [Candidatus Omnitrophica bacterium]|nr:preprotein translocase subunit YajC [Candidatus Omnitrophota bacterium]